MGTSGDRWDELARYNADCHRGVQFTEATHRRMAAEQEAFNAEERARYEAEGWTEARPGMWVRDSTRRERLAYWIWRVRRMATHG